MVRGSSVPDSDLRPAGDALPHNSPQVKPLRLSLKFLAAYAVAIVNGAALLYILIKIFAGLRGLLDAN